MLRGGKQVAILVADSRQVHAVPEAFIKTRQQSTGASPDLLADVRDRTVQEGPHRKLNERTGRNRAKLLTRDWRADKRIE